MAREIALLYNSIADSTGSRPSVIASSSNQLNNEEISGTSSE